MRIEESMIKAIIFDADGMVINGAIFSNQLERDYNITSITVQPFFMGVFQDCLVGKADLKEVLPSHLSKWGWKGSVDDFLEYWFKAEHKIDERIIEKIKELQQKGIKFYLATNQEKYRAAYLKNEMGFGDVFDTIYASALVGFKKPQREFFEYIQKDLEKQRITKDEVVFWDDQEKNVRAAEEFGWNAKLYKEYDEFEKEIEDNS